MGLGLLARRRRRGRRRRPASPSSSSAARSHASPILELSLLRERRYAIAVGATALFSTAFGAMLLSIVLWLQDDWGWSALRAGLAVAPGPLMVPGVSLLSGRLIPRLGSGGVIAAGCAFFAGGVVWWETAVRVTPDYLGDAVGGMLLTGIGVGLASPPSSRPRPPRCRRPGSQPARRWSTWPGRSASLSASRSSSRCSHAPDGRARLVGFQHGWLVIAGTALAAGLAALALELRRPASGGRARRSP